MAQVDYFLKVDGIDGESTDDKHKGEIDVLAWNWKEEQRGDFGHGGGGGAGKISMGDFEFTAKISKASPKLFLACATGEHIKKATFVARKAGKDQQEYLKIVFSEFIVSNYKTNGGESDILPTDTIALNFAKVEWEYKEQKPDGTLGGSVKTGYNVVENKKV